MKLDFKNEFKKKKKKEFEKNIKFIWKSFHCFIYRRENGDVIMYLAIGSGISLVPDARRTRRT